MENHVILGENAFAAISAVEGLSLSQADRSLIADLRRKGRTNDEIRKIVFAQISTRKAA